jgi:hypothetical protein
MKLHKSTSNQAFGLFFAGFFVFLSIYCFYIGKSNAVVLSWLISAATLGLIALVSPSLLSPFNCGWMKLGELLGNVISPVVLGVIFFMFVTLVALISRFFGRDELRLKKVSVSSYWIDRVYPCPTGDSFNNQF